MTTPNGPAGMTPGQYGVTGSDGSVAGMKNRSQANVSVGLKAGVAGSTGWGGANTTFFGSLMGGFLNGVTGFISNLFGGLSGTSGGGFLDLLGSLLGTKTTVETHEVKIGDLETAIADLGTSVDPSTPQYVGNSKAIVTCPRGDLFVIKSATTTSDTHSHAKGSLAANTSTGVISGTTATDSHNHAVTLLGGLPVFTPAVSKLTSPGTGTVYYVPALADRYGHPDTFRFLTGADGSLFGIDAFFIALCVMDISTGVITKIWDPGDIKGAMSSSLKEMYVDMSAIAAADVIPGQALVFAHMQTAPGLAQTSRSMAMKPEAGVKLADDEIFEYWYYTTSSMQTSIPATVNLSSLVGHADMIPYFGMKVSPA